MLRNLGDGVFLDVARPAGADCVRDSRGVAIVDLDRDGRLDLVIANNDAEPTIYFNDFETGHHWLQVELRGTRSNHDAIGAEVSVELSGGRRMLRQVEAGAGYASQSMLAVHFGLGEEDHVEVLEVRWPGGGTQRFEGPQLAAALDRRVVVVEGEPVLTPTGDP